ncbi:hypothetical protein [Rhodovulum sp. PH10]|uniref:hypothetical protein n=1 Tax=Rhodovulum sp. PH10 TaxID=1187851 RepID=UPI0012F881DF|nr:hypothetical protein [Rhodovulum sp. PH10]
MSSADDEDQITVRYIREHQGTSIGAETRVSSSSARSLLEAGIVVDAREWHAARAAALSAEFGAIEIDPAATLAHNFVNAVIADRKVQAAGVWVCLEAPRFRPVFERGVYPEAIDNGLRKWPVVLDLDRLTAQFRPGGTSGTASNPFGDRSFWERRPTPVNEEVAGLVVSAIVDRHQNFFAPLCDGRLMLDGVFRATGTLQQVEPRSLDARKWIDLDDTGLYELEPDGSFRHVWEGLTIRSAEASSASVETTGVTSPAAVEPAPVTAWIDVSRLGRRLQKVHVAVVELWQGTIPAVYGPKEIHNHVHDHLQRRKMGTVSPSTIKRYMQEYRQAEKNRQS